DRRRGEIDRARSCTRPAYGTARLGEKADEIAFLATLDAGAEMRQIAGHPEQLQLESEPERVVCGATGAPLALVERVEEARQRRERALVRLLLGEQAQHRLEPDQPDLEPVGVGTRPVVRPDQGRPGDGVELAAAVMEDELDVRKRLQPPPEPRFR